MFKKWISWLLIIIIVFGITGTASADIPIVGFEDEEQSQWADFAFPNDGLTEQQTNPENSSNGIPLISIYDSGNNEQEQLTSDTDNTPVFTETVPATELGIGEMNSDGQYNRQYSNEAKTTVTAAQLLKMIQDGDETATTLAKQLGFGYRTEDQIANLTKLVEEYALFPDFIEPGFEIDDVNIKLDKEITEDTEDGLSGYRTTINVETTAAITIQYDERGETKIIRRVPSANPTDFVITLDVSGSMNYYGRDKAMFSALETLLKEIFEDPKNTASVIFWADNASVMRLDINQDGIIESTFSGENGITIMMINGQKNLETLDNIIAVAEKTNNKNLYNAATNIKKQLNDRIYEQANGFLSSANSFCEKLLKIMEENEYAGMAKSELEKGADILVKKGVEKAIESFSTEAMVYLKAIELGASVANITLNWEPAYDKAFELMLLSNMNVDLDILGSLKNENSAPLASLWAALQMKGCDTAVDFLISWEVAGFLKTDEFGFGQEKLYEAIDMIKSERIIYENYGDSIVFDTLFSGGLENYNIDNKNYTPGMFV